MANTLLFHTSLLCTLIQMVACALTDPPLTLHLTVIVGCCTSLWNHGSTSATARYTDRAAMCVGLIIDLYTTTPARAACLCLCVLGYAAGKAAHTPLPHAAAHGLLTGYHVYVFSSLEHPIHIL